MERYTTLDGLLQALTEKLNSDNAPFYEATLGEWLDKHSEVDLIEIKPGVMGEVHNELYRGTRYEITIITRWFKDDHKDAR